MSRRRSENGGKGGSEWFEPGLHFACNRCGNCCTGPPGYVWFSEAEGRRIAEHLGVSEAEFRKRYARRVGRKWTLEERENERGRFDCVFLEWDEQGKALCSIYPVRPTQCQTWPFWPENLKSRKMYQVAGRVCPGVQKGLKGEGTFYPVEQVRIHRDRTP